MLSWMMVSVVTIWCGVMAWTRCFGSTVVVVVGVVGRERNLMRLLQLLLLLLSLHLYHALGMMM